MKLSVTKSDLARLECEFLALPFSSGELKKEAAERLSALGIDQQVLKDFKGDAGELVVVYGEADKCSAVRIALLGLGEKVTLDDWRKAAVAFASRAVDMKIGKIAVDCSGIEALAAVTGQSVSTLAAAFVEGCFAGSYRFDRLKSGKLDKKEAVLDSVDAIVLEDYNKGLLGAQLIQQIITSAKRHNVPVLVDPKHQNFFAYKGCTIFKPNLSEMAASLGIILHNNDREVEDACLLLQKKLEADAIIVTRSDKGMTVYNGAFTHIEATSLEVADVSGAGDTVIGILALGTAAHIDIVTNAIIANLAAGTVCQEVGAVPVNPEKLLKVYQEYLQQ